MGILPAFTNVKFASLQLEDVLLLGIAVACALRFIARGSRVRVTKSVAIAIREYALLLSLLWVASIFALRLQLYPLQGVSILKAPLLYSISRFLQFAAVTVGFLWLTHLMQKDRQSVEKALSAYWITGLATCIYGLVSYAMLRFVKVDLGGAYGNESLRVRGFFNEGGPFGLYVVSIFAVGLMRTITFRRKINYTAVVVLSAAFLMSFSKAGYFAIGLVAIALMVSQRSLVKQTVHLLIAVSLLAACAVVIHPVEMVRNYIASYEAIDSSGVISGVDPSLVMGRVAGAHIVPKMIAAHPLLGIGIGNYPLMRNDPKYLGSLPPILNLEDEPGLGLIGYTAEFGIPAILLLCWLLLMPFRVCRRHSSALAGIALYQPIAHLLGAQVTFFYPWFVSACALGCCTTGVKPAEQLNVRQKPRYLSDGKIQQWAEFPK